MSSVKAHVPVILSNKAANYTCWSTFFEAMVGWFGLLSHIDGSTSANLDDSSWVQADCTVRIWLYCSVHEEVLDVMIELNQTAHDLWTRIHDLFYANQNAHAIYLSHQFHSLMQGDLSVTDYFQCLKTTADALRDVGHQVEDAVNALRGLSPRLKTANDIISFQDPLPSLSKVRSLPLLHELKGASSTGSSNRGHTKGCNKSRGKGGGHRATAPLPVPSTGPWVCNTLWGPQTVTFALAHQRSFNTPGILRP
ncbi:uncharacterized protein LOC133899386 [Phragmites australis]|uniref:uncharacterized protein LOC133899386 n=1 Tax=Phragmites australis TaxID=29695 RepID=UPI002D795C80|nr:uncharacterized protein LOC133899386 [Phragmites australis]